MVEKDSSQSKTSQPPIGTKNKHGRTGWSQMRSTELFRVVNPELFIKPNKYVMGVGIMLISGCVAYVAYLNATTENKHNVYMAMDEKGELNKQYRTSRWD